jgi:hypothetical protein
MKKIILSLVLYFIIISSYTLAQFQFEDYFDSYIPNQQLVCQNPIDWTTWNNCPCCPPEDPYISSNYSYSSSHSVVIVYSNDLIKPLGDYTTYGVVNIGFYFYIPSNRTGYFALLSKFTPDPYEWGAECYFDLGENGRLVIGSSEIINFNYQYDEWQFVKIDVFLNSDLAQLSINHLPIHLWQWSQNGTISNQLAVQNFWGEGILNEMYIDNYTVNDNLLSDPPNTPSNLFAQQIFNPETQVQLDWQDNSLNEYAFKIIRKNGLSNSTNSYFIIDTVYSNITQYIDSNVTVDSTYTYGIIAFNIYGNSDTSNFATITVDPVTNLNEQNNLTSYSLDQNYPNPFNPVTSIQYVVSSRQFVTLKVFDVLGNEVATLVKEEKPTGEYEIEFDAQGLTSGVYFYQLKAGSFIQTKKMVLLR